MHFIKVILSAIFIVVLVGAGSLIALNRGWWKPPTAWAQTITKATQVAKVAQAINSQIPHWREQAAKLPHFSEQVDPQLQVLGARTEEVRQHVNGVVNQSIKDSDKPTPLHEKAFEKAQYLYCQEVVREYEKQEKAIENRN